MSKPQKRWAKIARARLLQELGGCCRVCGATDFLTFDCIEPRGHEHHTFDTERRICFYRHEHSKGNIQILCQRCNARKGDDSMEQAFGELFARMLAPLGAVEVEAPF